MYIICKINGWDLCSYYVVCTCMNIVISTIHTCHIHVYMYMYMYLHAPHFNLFSSAGYPESIHHSSSIRVYNPLFFSCKYIYTQCTCTYVCTVCISNTKLGYRIVHVKFCTCIIYIVHCTMPIYIVILIPVYQVEMLDLICLAFFCTCIYMYMCICVLCCFATYVFCEC